MYISPIILNTIVIESRNKTPFKNQAQRAPLIIKAALDFSINVSVVELDL
jgi:hypothetical protein